MTNFKHKAKNIEQHYKIADMQEMPTLVARIMLK
jgi:hypothetical protein